MEWLVSEMRRLGMIWGQALSAQQVNNQQAFYAYSDQFNQECYRLRGEMEQINSGYRYEDKMDGLMYQLPKPIFIPAEQYERVFGKTEEKPPEPEKKARPTDDLLEERTI